MNEVIHIYDTIVHVPCFIDSPPTAGIVSCSESEVFSCNFFSANSLTDFSRQSLLVIICDKGVLKTVT